MTLLLYIAFLPRYQLRTQDGGDGEDQEDQDGGDGGMCQPTSPIQWAAACYNCRWGVRQKGKGAQ